MPTKLRKHLVRFYLLSFGVLVVFSAFEAFYVSHLKFAEEELKCINEFQKEQLGIFVEMNHVLTALATASLGAMGAFLFHRYKASDVLPVYQLWRATGSWVFSGLSLYCGYLSYDKLVWMLNKNFFNLFNPQVLWPARIQFWAFAVSSFLIADFVFRALRKEDG